MLDAVSGVMMHIDYSILVRLQNIGNSIVFCSGFGLSPYIDESRCRLAASRSQRRIINFFAFTKYSM